MRSPLIHYFLINLSHFHYNFLSSNANKFILKIICYVKLERVLKPTFTSDVNTLIDGNGYITGFGLYVRENILISYESTLVERELSK